MRHDRPVADDISALQAQLGAHPTRTNIQVDEIRKRVCSLVDKMKADGAPPEKVVVAVKTAVLSLLRPIETLAPAEFKEAEKLLHQALTWCLEQYFGPQATPDDIRR